MNNSNGFSNLKKSSNGFKEDEIMRPSSVITNHKSSSKSKKSNNRSAKKSRGFFEDKNLPSKVAFNSTKKSEILPKNSPNYTLDYRKAKSVTNENSDSEVQMKDF